MIIRILDRIAAGPGEGEFYSFNQQSKDRWAGNVIMEDASRTEDQAKQMLKDWKDNGVLEEGQYRSPKSRKETNCIKVNKAKVDEMRRDHLSRNVPPE